MRKKSTFFNLYHPSCAIAYFVLAICVVMLAFHPVITAVFFVAGFAFSLYLRGTSATVQSLKWQLPMVFLIAVVNPLFSASGSTELFKIGTMAIYAESLAYGFFMGLMLVGMLLWFSNLNNVVSQEGLMSVCAGVIPTVTLMISMAMRLVPMLKRRGKEISDVQLACTAANDSSNALHKNAKVMSVLMGWSMEDSLQMADSMKVSGWGESEKRTTYVLHRFRMRDGILLAIICALGAVCALFCWLACSAFSFYPTIRGITLWAGYLPIAIFAFLPLIAQALTRNKWN